MAPEENGDNLFWIVGRQLAAAELQLGRNLWTVVVVVLVVEVEVEVVVVVLVVLYHNSIVYYKQFKLS